MATRIDLPKVMLQDALDQKIASLKRANNNERNSIIKDARQQEINHIMTALSGMTDVK